MFFYLAKLGENSKLIETLQARKGKQEIPQKLFVDPSPGQLFFSQK